MTRPQRFLPFQKSLSELFPRNCKGGWACSFPLATEPGKGSCPRGGTCLGREGRAVSRCSSHGCHRHSLGSCSLPGVVKTPIFFFFRCLVLFQDTSPDTTSPFSSSRSDTDNMVSHEEAAPPTCACAHAPPRLDTPPPPRGTAATENSLLPPLLSRARCAAGARCSVGRPLRGLTGGDYCCQPHIREN